MTKMRDVLLTEVALRDGSHAVRHQFTVEQVTMSQKHWTERMFLILKFLMEMDLADLHSNMAYH